MLEEIERESLKALSLDELAARMPKRHLAFVEHYLTDAYLNPIEAYLMVYPNIKRSTARCNGYRLLDNAFIRAYIEKCQQEMRDKQKVKREWLIDKAIENLSYGIKGRREMTFDPVQGKVVPTGEIIKDQRAINDSIRLITALTGLDQETITDGAMVNELSNATQFVVSVRKQREIPKSAGKVDDEEEDTGGVNNEPATGNQ